MNYVPAFTHMPSHKRLKWSGLLLACATILPELIMALVLQDQPQSRIIALIGVIFGLIMSMLWAIHLPQNKSVLPEAAPAYVPYTPIPTYPASLQSQLFLPSSPEPVPGSSQEKKYQDERGVQGFTFA